MPTNTMDAVARALGGVLPASAIAQLTSALGNCAQTLAHRGNINVQPSLPKNTNGAYGPGVWNLTDQKEILPPADDNTNNYNYGGNQFYFPTNQEFLMNQFFGGPTNYLGGNTYVDNVTTEELTTNNVNTTTINNIAAPGPPGDAGPAGMPGLNGVDGRDFIGVAGFNLFIFNLNGKKQKLVVDTVHHSYVTDARFDEDKCAVVVRKGVIKERTYRLIDDRGAIRG